MPAWRNPSEYPPAPQKRSTQVSRVSVGLLCARSCEIGTIVPIFDQRALPVKSDLIIDQALNEVLVQREA